MESSKKLFEGMDITASEVHSMTEALKKTEFRQLLAEYCAEVSDPANQKRYEDEMRQYGADQGMDVTFITPEPGFVVKTTVDGRQKAFINISQCERVAKPTSAYGYNEQGVRGLNWSIPLVQSPPRPDLDNRRVACVVYDVVFHPDSLHLGARNQEFRRLLIDTACDAVESAFSVCLDRTNLKYPKLAFKGTPRATVIRKKAACSSDSGKSSSSSSSGSVSDTKLVDDSVNSDSFRDEFKPPPFQADLDQLNGDRPPRQLNAGRPVVAEYTAPKFQVVHRQHVEMHEMTNAPDAKLNATVPKELVVTVHLPLLDSAANVRLDVTERRLALVSERPAKYKLAIPLPYPVESDGGRAQFDSRSRQLNVTLPVLTEKCRKQFSTDSGLDSSSGSQSQSSGSDDDHSSIVNEEQATRGEDREEEPAEAFLERDRLYQLPAFTVNVLDDLVAFTLNVKNVDPESVQVNEAARTETTIQVKFASIGSGFAPNYYAFCVQFDGACTIGSVSAEAWDNNVILQVSVIGAIPESYRFGLDGGRGGDAWQQGALPGTKRNRKTEKGVSDGNNNNKDTEELVLMQVTDTCDKTIQIDLKSTNKIHEEAIVEESEKLEPSDDVFTAPQEQQGAAEQGKLKSKDTGRKNNNSRKGRSLSESHCEVLKGDAEERERDRRETKQKEPKVPSKNNVLRKSRSMSESNDHHQNGDGFHFKGILKRRTFNRSTSESAGSSMDGESSAGMVSGGGYSVSLDLGVGSLVEEMIPEEEGGLSESCKKTVTFSDVIKKQLFRADSSIVGRKLKNLKKRAKRNHQDSRRLSESENSEGEEREKAGVATTKSESFKRNVVLRRSDSGCSSDGGGSGSGVDKMETATSKQKMNEGGNKKTKKGGKSKGRQNDFEFKSGMIFNLEM